MLKTVLLSTAALAFVATTAVARPQVTLTNDNRVVAITPVRGASHATEFVPGTKYLFTNFATREKKGVYLSCCSGVTISGPSSFLGEAYGVAEQFTLSAAATATSLAAAVGYVSGNNSVTLTLYADNGKNSPGAELASGTGTARTEFGLCCKVASAKIASTNLTGGTPYWIGITTTGSNFEAAAYQISNQVDEYAYVASTANGGTTWSSGTRLFGTSLLAIGIK